MLTNISSHVMQEHRQLIKRASTSSGDRLDKQTQILKCFGIVAQVFNEVPNL